MIPFEPEGQVLVGHSIAIHNGHIEAVLPTAEARSIYRAELELERSEHLLIPGLINSHTHAAMSLIRGLAAAYHAGADSVTGENKGSATSIMVNYSSGPLYASAAVESISDTVADALKSATKLGLGYGFGPAYLGLVHQTLSYDGTKKDVTETYLSAKFKASDVIDIKAAYGMRDDGLPGDDAVMSAIGMDYKMDKSAKIYVFFANGSDGGMSNTAKLNGDASALALGIEYNF